MSTTPAHVALITGGARRVGRAIALRLAHAGYDIAITYLGSESEAKSLETEVAALRKNYLAIRADLLQPLIAAQQIRRQLAEKYSRLDVLVNNASIYEPDANDPAALLEQHRRMNALHVESPMLLCNALSPWLEEAGGHVVNMVDLLVERPRKGYSAYCASKAALWNLTLSHARQLAPRVTVNGIAPGTIEWPDDLPQAEKEKYLKRVPLGKAGTPADAAEAVNFFCTGGKYVTGQILHLDGGRSIT